MVKVAIAGGTGDVGRTILEVIKEYPQHEAVVLTRKLTPKDLGIPAVTVNYDDVDELKQTLEGNNIHTVICALNTDEETASNAQLNLIKASVASSSTRRFVPSVFAVAYPEEARDDPMFKGYFAAVDELKKTELQWTLIINGIFLDYFAISRIKSNLRPYPIVIDIEHKMAALPGDGKGRVTFTYSFDVARYLVALLELEEWPLESRIAGDTVSWIEFVALAEKVTGTAFKVVYDDMEKLKRSEITELPCHVAAYANMPKEVFQATAAMFEVWTLNSDMVTVPPEVNAKFPQIKPLTVESMLEQCWKIT